MAHLFKKYQSKKALGQPNKFVAFELVLRTTVVRTKVAANFAVN